MDFHVTKVSAAELKLFLMSHFTHVKLLGLRGGADFVNVERERSARAKRTAFRERGLSGRILRGIRNAVPRADELTPRTAPAPRLPNSVIEQWTTGQFYKEIPNEERRALAPDKICQHSAWSEGIAQS
jgi:hypothetical protein